MLWLNMKLKCLCETLCPTGQELADARTNQSDWAEKFQAAEDHNISTKITGGFKVKGLYPELLQAGDRLVTAELAVLDCENSVGRR